MLRVISNAKTHNYGEWRVVDYRSFWIAPLTVDTRGSDFSLWAVGSPRPMTDMVDIADAIRHYHRHAPDRSLEIARTMARVIVAGSTKTLKAGDPVQVAIMPRVGAGQQYLTMPLGPIAEPLTEITSFELNSKEREGFIISNDLNGVVEGMAFRGGVVGPGDAYPIGPQKLSNHPLNPQTCPPV